MFHQGYKRGFSDKYPVQQNLQRLLPRCILQGNGRLHVILLLYVIDKFSKHKNTTIKNKTLSFGSFKKEIWQVSKLNWHLVLLGCHSKHPQQKGLIFSTKPYQVRNSLVTFIACSSIVRYILSLSQVTTDNQQPFSREPQRKREFILNQPPIGVCQLLQA